MKVCHIVDHRKCRQEGAQVPEWLGRYIAVLKEKIDETTDSEGEWRWCLCEEIQKKLIYLGYSCGVYGSDGEFGSGTLAAVNLF